MEAYLTVEKIIKEFHFTKGDYASAERQLLLFSQSYALLTDMQADAIRSSYDAKDRLGWLRIATILLKKFFQVAPKLRRKDLLNIFFSLYSFENLDHGYDAVMDLIEVSEKVKDFEPEARILWDVYKPLTSNAVAVENLEKKLF